MSSQRAVKRARLSGLATGTARMTREAPAARTAFTATSAVTPVQPKMQGTQTQLEGKR